MSARWAAACAAMAISGAICALAGLYVWRRPGAIGRRGLAASLAAAAIWGLAYGVELALTTPAAKLPWGAAKYVGIAVLPATWLVFALQYTGRERLVTRRLIAALAPG